MTAAAVFAAVSLADNAIEALFGGAVEGVPSEALVAPSLGSSTELMVPPVQGELVDVGTFEPAAAGIFDPSGAFALPDLQVTSALYDGLTDFDPDAPGRPVPFPAVAARWEVSDDARVWTFHVRRDLTFSDATPVLPSSFVRGWERATGPYGGFLGHLLAPIEGATEKLLGEAPTIAGLAADDEAMTLRVTLAEPMADFDAVVAHPVFSPLPVAVDQAPDPAVWGRASLSSSDAGTVVGNGPFVQEGPAPLFADAHLVPNPRWNGTRYDPALALPARPQVDRLIFRVATRPDAEQAMLVSAGVTRAVSDEGTAATAAGASSYGSTAGRSLAGAAFLSFDWDDAVVGGPGNAGLRRAIALALDRPLIDALYQAPSRPANALTPPELSGAERPCETPGCDVQVEPAREALAEWQASGGRLDAPLEIVHDDSPDDVAIGQELVRQLEAVGIPARSVALAGPEYRQAVDAGTCQVCWRTWSTTVPTAGGVLRQLLSQDYVTPGNTGGYVSPAVGRGLQEAAAVRDPAARAEAYRQVEAQALADGAVVPVLWTAGDYLYNERVTSFPQHMSGLVAWEQVTIP